ncbi:MAG: acyl-CoA thioesterase [Bacteroidetes bacterium]|nr:acyl-CoA thioesterase [Bacteroidota bacterium]
MVQLSDKIKIRVRFSEVDSLTIVWHGHYLKYFEDAREALLSKYGLAYLEMYDQGYVAPIISAHCEYKLPLTYGDTAVIEAIFLNTEAAKIIIDYTITHGTSGKVVATGRTVQVFLDRVNRQLQLANPDFYTDWKGKWGLDV